jgi:cobalt-zinc-cadmium efflux system outer membrane protein
MVEVQQAVIAYRKLSLDVRNQVQLAHAAMANAKARAQTYRQLMIPARMAATQRAQEEENFMLIGTFELIEVKQDEYAAYAGYLNALRDYWLARADLRYAVGNSLPSSTEPEGKQIHVESLIQPPAHSGHGHPGAPQTQTPAPHQRVITKTLSPHKSIVNTNTTIMGAPTRNTNDG